MELGLTMGSRPGVDKKKKKNLKSAKGTKDGTKYPKHEPLMDEWTDRECLLVALNREVACAAYCVRGIKK